MQLGNSRLATGRGQRIFQLAGIMALLFSLPVTALALQYGIIEHVLPTIGGNNLLLATGPDGYVWFAGGQIETTLSRITPSGAITQYPAPGEALGITAGPDGALWFTIGGAPGFAAIGRMTTSGAASTYILPHPYQANVGGITTGPDGALWFTGSGGIGYITTSGTIVQRGRPELGLGSILGPIVTGSDGALWLIVRAGIARCTTHFVCTTFPDTTHIGPDWIAEGSDGAIWFTGGCSGTPGGCSVGRITTDGVYSSYPVPNTAGVILLPQISAGNDGALWFGAIGQIVRMTTGGVVTEYPLPDSNAYISGIVWGPGGVWFAELSLGFAIVEGARIGVVAPLTASIAAEPSSFTPGTGLTLTGNGFAPGETVNLLYSAHIGKELPKTTTADSSGSFVITGPAGPAIFGDGSVSAVGQSSRKLGVATVLVNPHMTLTPNSGSAGDTISVRGSGFFLEGTGSGTGSVGFFWTKPFKALGSATGTPEGGVTEFTFTIPEDALPGEQLIVSSPYGNGQPQIPEPNGMARAYLNVLAAAPSQ